MKLFVTGGAGFIGANFIHYWLQEQEGEIVNFDVLTYAGNLQSLKAVENDSRYSFVLGDIRKTEQVMAAMKGCTHVVHFAAETHVDRSIVGPQLFLETNVLGTQVLLDAALKNGIERFHHISTDEVFGSLGLGSEEKFSELTNYDPRSPYSASKAGSDHLVRAYGETYGLPYTLTNCSNNYGPYQHPEKLIPLAITNLLQGKKVPVYGDGLNVRDWLFVKDHCRAIAAVLLNGQDRDTYLIGGLTEDVSNIDLVKMLIEKMGMGEEMIEFVEDRKGHDRRYAVNWTKIHNELGWEPSVTLEEGIDATIEWYSTHLEWWQE